MVPPRLHVLLARASRKAVVIRRGPSRHTAVVGWDRSRDRFRLGQWLYGRIYERRCDLSPEGDRLIYFAMNGKWGSEAKGAWSAISREPWLKAESLFAKGDCWHGGGLFTSSSSYWLNDGYGHHVLHDRARLRRDSSHPWPAGVGGECLSVYFSRLQRDGWVLASHRGYRDEPVLFDKRISDKWKLRKFAHASLARGEGRGVYFDTHELVDARSGERQEFPAWEWADVDGARIVLAERGCLYAARVRPDGSFKAELLRDFTDMEFERQAAPY